MPTATGAIHSSPSPTLLVPVADAQRLDPSWRRSTSATYRLIRAGKLSCYRVGRRLYLSHQDLRDFVRTTANVRREPKQAGPSKARSGRAPTRFAATTRSLTRCLTAAATLVRALVLLLG